jgi:D-sedoheptulose 7-phosphate isomerase
VSALCLNADAMALGALTADYGAEDALARELAAHGRGGDVLVAYVTGPRSEPSVAALHAARRVGMTIFAITGQDPGDVAGVADEVLPLPATSRQVLQELQLVTVHLLAAALDRELALSGAGRSRALVHR